MSNVTATIKKQAYKTEITSHNLKIIADEPIALGGQGLGFSPYELIMSSLASCTAITIRMYADKKNWELDECEVNVSMDFEDGQTYFQKDIKFIGNLNDLQKKRLSEIADKCFIHKLLTKPININTELI